MNRRASILSVSLVVLAVLPGLALAQKKVPGEKWRQTMSMQMAGMSMPPQTTEICAPVGKASESMSKSGDKNCSVYDVQTSGNKYSAKVKCTGKDAVEGTVETVMDGNTMRGTSHMKTADGEMTMKYESTKLGACEAIDYSDYKPPMAAAVPAYDSEALCKKTITEIQQDPAKATEYVSLYLGSGAGCAKSPTFKAFCAAAQSHRGFVKSDLQEQRMMRALAATGSNAGGQDPYSQPLTVSLAACGVAKTPSAIDDLRKKLLATAAAQNEWEFLLGEGTEADFPPVVAMAKRECSGRGYTSASNPRYARLCGEYGPMLVRGDRAGALSVLRGECSGDCGSNPDAATGRGNASAAATGSAVPGDQPAPAKETAKDKAKDAVDKGKKLLRGLLGGG